MSRRLASLGVLVPLLLAGCAGRPSEDVPLARERTVADQVLAFDSSAASGGDTLCGSRKIAARETSLPYERGSQGAAGQWTERWMVDRCGRQVPYLVTYTRAADGHLGVAIMRLEGYGPGVIPGGTIADPTLQLDAFLLLAQKDLSELEGGPCRGRKVTNTEVVSPLEGREVEEGRPVAGQWVERWTLDRCGAPIPYIIRFTTTRTGTTFSAEREK